MLNLHSRCARGLYHGANKQKCRNAEHCTEDVLPLSPIHRRQEVLKSKKGPSRHVYATLVKLPARM
jgi:hypothetical protein